MTDHLNTEMWGNEESGGGAGVRSHRSNSSATDMMSDSSFASSGFEEVTEEEAINTHTPLASPPGVSAEAAAMMAKAAAARSGMSVHPASLHRTSFSAADAGELENSDHAPVPSVASSGANSSTLGIVAGDGDGDEEGGHHSLPLPEPRKAYYHRESEIRRRKCIIWSAALLLIIGVVGAFVGGFLAGETREEGRISDSASAAAGGSSSGATKGHEGETVWEGEESGGAGGGGDAMSMPRFRYRRTRRMTRKRTRIENMRKRGHDRPASALEQDKGAGDVQDQEEANAAAEGQGLHHAAHRPVHDSIVGEVRDFDLKKVFQA